MCRWIFEDILVCVVYEQTSRAGNMPTVPSAPNILLYSDNNRKGLFHEHAPRSTERLFLLCFTNHHNCRIEYCQHSQSSINDKAYKSIDTHSNSIIHYLLSRPLQKQTIYKWQILLLHYCSCSIVCYIFIVTPVQG